MLQIIKPPEPITEKQSLKGQGVLFMKYVVDYEKGEGYIQISVKELREGLSSKVDVDLFINILAYLNSSDMIAKPSQDLLAKNMGLSSVTVGKRIKAMLEKNPDLITRKLVGAKGKIGYMKHSEYSINIDVEAAQTGKQVNKAYSWTPPTAEEQAEHEAYLKYVEELLAKEEE